MAEITSVMTPNPASCRQDASLQAVANLMIQHDCGQIPVVDDAGAPVGVVTDLNKHYSDSAYLRSLTYL